MRTRFLMTTAASVFALSVAGSATAQQEQGQTGIMDEQLREKIELTDWNYQDLYESGWRAEELIGSTVIGADGSEIGEVSNITVGANDTAEAIIIEAGGFLDIGNTYLRVPWDEVQWSPDADQVEVPVQAENVDSFSLFEEQYTAATPATTAELPATQGWRVTQLIGDYVSLADRPGYGIIDDIIFSPEGKVQAVLVEPDVAYEEEGPYALPYYPEGSMFEGVEEEPGMSVGMASAQAGEQWYGVPYSYQEVQELEAFDTEQMER